MAQPNAGLAPMTRRIRTLPDGTLVDDDAMDWWKAQRDAASRARNQAADATFTVERVSERKARERRAVPR